MELGYKADDVQAQTKVGCDASLGPVSDQGVKISLLATRPETGCQRTRASRVRTRLPFTTRLPST